MLIKRCLLLLAILLLFLVPAYAKENANLLRNSSFEEIGTNGLPTGWFTDAYVKREGISQENNATMEEFKGSAVSEEN